MSFKDLEAEIRAWAQLEAYASKQKEDAKEAKRQAKRDKRNAKQKQTGKLVPKKPAHVERPMHHFKRVTLEVREIRNRHWGDIEEITFEVETISSTVAELEAIRQARLQGYSFEAVVCIVSFSR